MDDGFHIAKQIMIFGGLTKRSVKGLMLKNWGVYLTAMFIRCGASLLNATDTMFLAFV